MPSTPTPKEIREAFEDYSEAASHILEEGRTDMRFVAGDPWDPMDRLAREDAHRPCMAFDEINQYLVQWTGQIRQNPRAVEVTPESEDATDKNAEKRANVIRGIEYRSRAQQAYTAAGDNMVMRSFGYARITAQPVGGKSFDLELRIKPVLNPGTIIYSPRYRMPDGSDVEEAFELDFISHKEFKRRFRNAKVRSFSGEHMDDARNWIRENDIQIAGFWKVHIEHKTLLLVETQEGDVPMWEDDLMGGFDGRNKLGKFSKLRDTIRVKREMRQEVRKVVQYVTNGIEILDTVPWYGTRIPLPACFGKELFMDMGGGPKRHLISMVRLARDPAMFHAYAISQQAEEFGQAPKAPLKGFKGQFESDQVAIENSSKVPRAMLQFDIPDDWNPQWGPPPLPNNQQFEPNPVYMQAVEMARQSVRSAFGLSPLPTAAQRLTEKSGVALDKIMKMESIGMLHFSENYDHFIENVGWQLNEMLGPVYDTARDVPIIKPDGTKGLLRLNDEQYEMQGMGAEKEVLHTDEGQYGVVVSVGRARDSEREEASELLDTLIENWQTLGIPPEIGQKILAKAIRMRNLGPVTQEIADLLSPPELKDLPPEVQAVIANLQAQISQLSQENQALLMDRAGKAQELQSKEKIETLRQGAEDRRGEITNIVKIVVAEIAAKSKQQDAQAQSDVKKALQMEGFQQDRAMALHQSAHELAIQASQPLPEAPASQ